MAEARLPFIGVSPTLRSHIKFVRLKRLLGGRDSELIGCLVLLWSQVFNDSPSGDVSRWTDDDIAACADWAGDAEAFVAALISAGFIVEGKINDWPSWGGFLYAARSSASERARRSRDDSPKAPQSQHESAVSRDVTAVSRDVTLPRCDVTSNLTERNLTEPNGTNMNSIHEQAPDLFIPSVSAPAETLHIAPTNGNGIHRKPREPQGPSADFEAFWAHVPRPVGKKAVLDKWNRLPASDRTKASKAMERFGQIWRAASHEQLSWCPLPLTWINQGRWDDDPAEWMRAASEKGVDVGKAIENSKAADSMAAHVEKMRKMGYVPAEEQLS